MPTLSQLHGTSRNLFHCHDQPTPTADLHSIEIWNVEFGEYGDGDPQASLFQTISSPGKKLFGFTAIEPDMLQVGLSSSENTTLYYWIEHDPAPANVSQIKGALVRDVLGWSGVFDISSTWTQPLDAGGLYARNGDYMKGAYYFDTAGNENRYIPVWIQNGDLHAAVLGVPR